MYVGRFLHLLKFRFPLRNNSTCRTPYWLCLYSYWWRLIITFQLAWTWAIGNIGKLGELYLLPCIVDKYHILYIRNRLAVSFLEKNINIILRISCTELTIIIPIEGCTHRTSYGSDIKPKHGHLITIQIHINLWVTRFWTELYFCSSWYRFKQFGCLLRIFLCFLYIIGGNYQGYWCLLCSHKPYRYCFHLGIDQVLAQFSFELSGNYCSGFATFFFIHKGDPYFWLIGSGLACSHTTGGLPYSGNHTLYQRLVGSWHLQGSQIVLCLLGNKVGLFQRGIFVKLKLY